MPFVLLPYADQQRSTHVLAPVDLLDNYNAALITLKSALRGRPEPEHCDRGVVIALAQWTGHMASLLRYTELMQIWLEGFHEIKLSETGIIDELFSVLIEVDDELVLDPPDWARDDSPLLRAHRGYLRLTKPAEYGSLFSDPYSELPIPGYERAS